VKISSISNTKSLMNRIYYSVFLLLIIFNNAVANPQGLSWLQAQQQQDDSYTLSTDITTPLQSSSGVITALISGNIAVNLAPTIRFLNRNTYRLATKRCLITLNS